MSHDNVISISFYKYNFTVRVLYLLCFIILLASALRFHKLDYQSLWLDEIHSMIGSSPETGLSDVIEYSRNDQPPAYFILLYYWLKVFGYTAFYARLLSAIIGVAGVFAVFFLGREIKNNSVGLLASLFTAVNYFHIYYSQEVRFYTLFFLAAAVSYLFFIRCCKNPKLLNYAGYVLFTTLTLYTHYFGLVLIASQALLFIGVAIVFKSEKKFIFYAIGSGIITALFISPWLPQLFNDAGIESFWIPAEKFPRFLANYLYEYIKDYFSFYVCGLLILYFMFITLRPGKKREEFTVQLLILYGWVIFGYGIPYLYSVLKMPMLISRYTIFILPAVLVMIVYAINAIPNTYGRMVVTLLIVLSSVRSLFFIKDYYDRIQKQQLREVAQEVVRENKNHVMISSFAWHYNFYLKLLKYEGKPAFHPWEPDLSQELLKADTVWILQAQTQKESFEEEMAKGDFKMFKEVTLHGARAAAYSRTKNFQ